SGGRYWTVRQYVSFTGLHAGTVELSLGLHASRQLSDKVLRSLLLLSRDLIHEGFRPVTISRDLLTSPLGSDFIFTAGGGDRRKVSEGSDLDRDRPSLRIVRTSRLLPRWVLEDTRGFPHMADFY